MTGVLSIEERASGDARPLVARLRDACGEELVARAARLLAPFAALQDAPPFSILTPSGTPLELTFRSNENAIRATVETGGADVPPRERLARAASIANVDAGALEPLHAGAALRWGGWLGMHVARDTMSYKLYAEVPESAQEQAAAFVERRTGVRAAVPRPLFIRMIGFAPRTLEIYYRVHELRPWELREVLAPLGLSDREPAVLDLFEDACEAALHRRFPWPKLGFSYAFRDGAPPVFSFYGFAFDLFGSDARARRRVLAFAARRGWDVSAYEAYSAPLATHDARDHHGMFGVSLGEALAPEVRIGLAAFA